MKTKVYRLYCTVLSALLSVLGFSSCSSDDDFPCEYGSPHADYIIDGIVTDEEGDEINGILVSAESYGDFKDGRYWFNLASKKSDYAGGYYLSFQSSPESSYTKLIVQDVDGEANGGEFANDTIDIDYKSAVIVKEGEGWNSGTYKITQNIQLKKK